MPRPIAITPTTLAVRNISQDCHPTSTPALHFLLNHSRMIHTQPQTNVHLSAAARCRSSFAVCSDPTAWPSRSTGSTTATTALPQLKRCLPPDPRHPRARQLTHRIGQRGHLSISIQAELLTMSLSPPQQLLPALTDLPQSGRRCCSRHSLTRVRHLSNR